jgi:hypothetical protein
VLQATNVRKEEKESGTPINAGPYPPHLRAARALQSALANRRSTTALCLWEYFIPRLNLGQAS